jgi:hypothetical protein
LYPEVLGEGMVGWWREIWDDLQLVQLLPAREYFDLFLRAFSVSLDALRAWCEVILVCLAPLGQLFKVLFNRILLPTLVSAWQWQLEQPESVWVFQALCIGLVVLLALLRRLIVHYDLARKVNDLIRDLEIRLTRVYESCLRRVETSSQVLAALFPHLLYFAVLLVWYFLSFHSLMALIDNFLCLFIVAAFVPALRSLLAPQTFRTRALFWIFWAGFSGIQAIVFGFLPMSVIMFFVPHWKAISVVWHVWLQLPHGAVEPVLKLTRPFALEYLLVLDRFSRAIDKVIGVGLLLFVPENHRGWIQRLILNCALQLPAVAGILSPFVTFPCFLYLGFFLPMAMTAGLVERHDRPADVNALKRYVDYWSVWSLIHYASLWTDVWSRAPFGMGTWYQIFLLFWLQFHGADFVAGIVHRFQDSFVRAHRD